MTTSQDTRAFKDLVQILTALHTPDDCRRFLLDLCTPGELRSLADRWRVARLVAEEVPYREIYEKTGVSTATITRVARCIKHGAEGYRRALGATTKNKGTRHRRQQ